jgi:hypothetical protein
MKKTTTWKEQLLKYSRQALCVVALTQDNSQGPSRVFPSIPLSLLDLSYFFLIACQHWGVVSYFCD